MSRARWSRLVIALALAATTASLGCSRRKATPDDCQAVLDRIIELELAESGYRDPALRKRWQDELERRFAPELARCRGLIVKADLRRCLDGAHTTEEIIHSCLN